MSAKNKQLIIYTDGGARGNPGPAGIGVVIKANDKLVKKHKEYIGETTNNQAEYRAVVKALELAKELKAEEVELRLDSELVTNQLGQEYKVKNKELEPWFIRAWNLSQGFKQISFRHVRREQNKQADELVNQAIDEALGAM